VIWILFRALVKFTTWLWPRRDMAALVRHEYHLLTRQTGVSGCPKRYEGVTLPIEAKGQEMVENAYSPLYMEKWRNRYD